MATSNRNIDIKPVFIDFVGDSMIERWDLTEYFQSWNVQNYGKSGARIDYIEMLKGRFIYGQIVVNIGINDNEYFSSENREEYASRYINAINELGADKIYLFSVLPCNFNGNSNVVAFNNVVKNRVQAKQNIVYIDVYSKFIDNDKIKQDLYCDGIHLSHKGYQVLADALKEHFI